MTITEPQARALAELLHQLRPEWVTTSILTLLWEHRNEHPFPELSTAAVTVANDSTKRTPGIIFMDGPHWHPQSPKATTGQQFLTAAEKSRLQGAQLMGYYSAKDGTDPSNPSDPMFQHLITPGDLDPAATLEAFRQGRARGLWEIQQQQGQRAIAAADPDTLEEAQP
ncbi:hypothetical protein [Arthrobacter dokdonensis]|uniref:hypothetical protein n=1 Tax=Arthrobacter dokdonellae TaxID=2211210 RepID=UPI000DE5BF04|nr:hypothetical protein [Arthrobacter dokdonellae]